MTNHSTQRIRTAAFVSGALLVVLSAFAGLVLATPAYDPGLMPTGKPQVAPPAPGGEPTLNSTDPAPPAQERWR